MLNEIKTIYKASYNNYFCALMNTKDSGVNHAIGLAILMLIWPLAFSLPFIASILIPQIYKEGFKEILNTLSFIQLFGPIILFPLFIILSGCFYRIGYYANNLKVAYSGITTKWFLQYSLSSIGAIFFGLALFLPSVVSAGFFSHLEHGTGFFFIAPLSKYNNILNFIIFINVLLCVTTINLVLSGLSIGKKIDFSQIVNNLALSTIIIGMPIGAAILLFMRCMKTTLILVADCLPIINNYSTYSPELIAAGITSLFFYLTAFILFPYLAVLSSTLFFHIFQNNKH